MNWREYKLLYGALILILVLGLTGSFVGLSKYNEGKKVELQLEQEKTKRSESRWDSFNEAIPWSKKK